MLWKGNEKLMSITKPNDKLLHDAAGAILENWDKNLTSIQKGRYYETWIKTSNSMLTLTINQRNLE